MVLDTSLYLYTIHRRKAETMVHSYGVKFGYREIKNGEMIFDYLFMDTANKDPFDQAEIECLKLAKKNNWYSVKVEYVKKYQ